jgi:predicted PurR-regulated permease PerM
LLLAFLAALMELIPVFGPIIAAVPAVALGFIDGGLTLALVVVGFYVIIQQFESQLIYPLVVRKVVGLSPIIVILALIVGFRLAGFLGVILSVPLATILLILVEDLEKKKRPKTAIDV